MMKKILFTALVAAMSTISWAQTTMGFTTITPGAGRYFLATALSNNGKYIAGSLGQDTGSGLYDVENETFYYYSGYGESEMTAVTDDGMLVGYGYSETTLLAINPMTEEKIVDSSVTDLWGKACVSDGSLIAGTYWDGAWRGHAGYWKNGKACVKLPEPDAEEIEFGFSGDDDDPADWSYQFTEAVGVSDDGSVIVGNVWGWVLNSGALIWRLNNDGDYELDAICAKLVENEYGDRPYYQYQATAVSANGKYMAMYLQDNDGTDSGGYTYMGRYDVETSTLEIAYYDGGDCCPSRIADDGTIIGWTGTQDEQSRKALIWMPGEEIMLMADKYSAEPEFAAWDSDQDWNFPVGITPDGRYIAGGGWHYFEGEGESYARWASWLFDTKQYASGISEVYTDAAIVFDGTEEYYTLDGKRLNAPQKGVTIVKKGSKVMKVLMP